MSDDEIIGLKSTSIKFKNNIGLFVTTSYLITIIFFICSFRDFFGFNIFTFFSIMFILSLFHQINKLKKIESKNLLRLFKFNNYTGLILFLGIFSISL